MNTFWDTLGIKPTTDIRKIRKAYSVLVKEHGPEDDEEAFKKINSAYKAAVNFAKRFESMNLDDDQFEITDVRPDGSFGIRITGKNGAPPPAISLNPAAVPEHDDNPQITDKLFDFDTIDSSIVKSFSNEELNEMSGFISLAPGFNVPDNKTSRDIRKFLNEDYDIVKTLAQKVTPESLSRCTDDAINVANTIITSKKFGKETVVWKVFFMSPLISGLYTDLIFYRRLEMLVNKSNLTVTRVYPISDASPWHPRVYSEADPKGSDPSKAVCRIDFQSRVPFRYKKGKYPELEKLMEKQDKDGFKKLVSFLEKIPVNLYGALMPVFPPVYKNAVEDAAFVFKYILTSPECKDMRNSNLLWRLVFRGKLINPVIKKPDIHLALIKCTMQTKIPKDTLKVIKKQMSFSGLVLIKRKKEDKDWYYLQIL